MRVEKISRTELQYEDYLKIHFDENSNICGRVSGIDELILICWSSELIEPLLVKHGSNLLIGVDNKIAVYNLIQKVMIALVPLSSRFLSFIVRKRSVVIISELEIFVLNTREYTIVNHVNLPDLVEDYQENEGGIRIICMDETALVVEC